MPVIIEAPEELEAFEDSPFVLVLTAVDEDGDPVTWTDDTDLFEIGPSNGSIVFTPSQGDVGEHTVIIIASDEKGATTQISIHITVTNTNDPPVISNVSPQNGSKYVEGKGIEFEVHATDEDGDPLEAEWIVGDERIGNGMRFTYKDLEPGSYIIVVRVTDGDVFTETSVEIKVEEVSGGDGMVLTTVGAVAIIVIILVTSVVLIRKRVKDPW